MDSPKFVGWAVGTSIQQSMIAYRNRLFAILAAYGDGSKPGHAHIFAGAAKTDVPLYAYIASKLPGLTLTVDGTNYMIGVRYRAYEFFDVKQFRMYDLEPGAKDAGVDPRMIMPCSCPVCQSLKYFACLSILPSKARVDLLLSLHNLFKYLEYFEFWNRAARTMSFEQYNKLVTQLYGFSIDYYFSYFTDVMEHGWAWADQKYAYFFRTERATLTTKNFQH
jgi:hypothetical protein